jgi:N-acetylmuramoyl-L-alanine amidase
MRKVSILPTIYAIIPAALSLSGCGLTAERETTSARSLSHARGAFFAGNPQHQSPIVKQGTYQTVTAPVPRRLPRKSPTKLLSEVKVRKDYISTSARGRRGAKSMRPRYVTIHSTQNWSSGADAWRHGLALKNSKLGKLSWHYTTDENVAVQHLPTNVTGRHADFDGPGNRYSIGIEMCEHPGNSRSRTVDRTAKLAAYLMYKYGIPLSRVVPHYHWPRHGRSPAHKNCPHFLLDNGRPGRKWRGFQAKVKRYHDDITKGGAVYVSR